MKHVKALAAVMAATALMAFASTAAATPLLTSPAGVDYTGEIDLSEIESTVIKAGFATITCTQSTIVAHITTNDTNLASGPLTQFTKSGCGSATVDTLSVGSFEFTSGGVTKTIGGEVTYSAVGTSCVYGGGTGTTIGTIAGGTPATLTVNASLPKISGGFLCANPASSSGKYVFTKPSTLLIDT